MLYDKCQFTGDLPHGPALIVQVVHRPMAFGVAAGQDMPGDVGVRRSIDDLVQVPVVLGLLVRDRLGQAAPMPDDLGLEMLAQVVPQVPAVRDLHRLGCSGPGSIRVGPATVPADDLGSGMGLQPLAEGVALAVRQQVDRPMGVHIDQDSSVDTPAAQGKVVDPEHPHWAHARVGQRHDQGQQRRPTHPRMQDPGQSRPGPTCQRQPDSPQHRHRLRGMPAIPQGQSLDLLDERATPALKRVTEQAPYRHVDDYRLPTHRHIGYPTPVATVDPPRRGLAPRTQHSRIHAGPAQTHTAVPTRPTRSTNTLLRCGNTTSRRSSHPTTMPPS